VWGLLLQVAELKRKLAELGLDNKGTKAELIARVEKYLTEQGACVSLQLLNVGLLLP
jgi:hypothetical protein